MHPDAIAARYFVFGEGRVEVSMVECLAWNERELADLEAYLFERGCTYEERRVTVREPAGECETVAGFFVGLRFIPRTLFDARFQRRRFKNPFSVRT